MNGLNSNMYPTFLEQLQEHNRRHPELYTTDTFDAYEVQLLADKGIWVKDVTKEANLQPVTKSSKSDSFLQDHYNRLRKLKQEQAAQAELERLKNMPILFKICSRLSADLKKLLK